MSDTDHRFQVDLGGMIDLLSHHLYSSPRVYVRELLQNGVDAITARRALKPDHDGQIRLEIIRDDDGRPTLIMEDDGIGLTAEEVHQFLATIGQSSKRGAVDASRETFIGQFGIGLLSCFMVCEEIVAITRSARGDHPVMEWRGRPDGTYSLRELTTIRLPGTQLFLRGKADVEDLMTLDTVTELARDFGELLPVPVTISEGDDHRTINAEPPPWRREWPSAAARRQALLDYGARRFETAFFDAIPLRSASGGVDGVAYVLPHPTAFGARQHHRVYLKNMLLAESMENLLPDWAFFVTCVVNAQDLRPTASRESFYEDDTLEACRDALGGTIEAYLREIAAHEPEQMEQLVALHYRALMALAVENDDLLRLFADWLPFETTAGRLTLKQIRERGGPVFIVDRAARFHQIAPIAKAQGNLVINACYTHNVEVLSNYARLTPQFDAQPLDVTEFTEQFTELTAAEHASVAQLLTVADRVLQPLNIQADVRRFLPDTLPAIFLENDAAQFLRSSQQAREVTTDLFASLLDSISAGRIADARSILCLNYDNPLTRKLAANATAGVADTALRLLYVQALLLGQYPMSRKDLDMLTHGMETLIDAAL